jgi:hypothetical protein
VASWASTFVEETPVTSKRALRIGWLFAALAWASSAHGAPSRPPSKVLAGPEGLTVTVVSLPPPAADQTSQVLVAVMGSGTVFDGKVISHKIEDVGPGRQSFGTTYHGRAWNTIVLRDSAYSLYLPGRRNELRVRFDEKRSAALKPEAIWAVYQKQKSDGTLEALATFDRPAEVARQLKGLQEVFDGFAKSCGARPALKLDWVSFSDADIQELSFASYCGEPLEVMHRLCDESKEARTAVADKVKTFTCAMGKSLKMELTGSTLGWTTSRLGSNLGDFARQYLEKAL